MDMRIVAAIIVAALLIVAIAAWAYAQKRRRLLLRERFGPEYDGVVGRCPKIRANDMCNTGAKCTAIC
jgi:hypothetical protein